MVDNLCEAAYNGDIEKVRASIYKDVSINSSGYAYHRSKFQVPLNFAIEANHVNIVRILLDEGAYMNYHDSAVELAVKNYRFEIFKILISRGGDVHLNDGSALKELIDRELVDWLQYLLKNGTNINRKYSDGTTPLSYAVGKKNIKMTKWLLENDAKYSAPTASLTAIQVGSLEILQILLQYIPDINHKYKNGTTCLITAIENQKSQIAIYLLEKGADPNVADSKGRLPFTVSLQLKQIEVLKKLLQAGAKIDFRNDLMKKTLDIFVEMNDKELTKTLLSHSKADDHATFLFEYIKNKNIDGVKLLVECGINLKITSKCGRTPLTMSVLTSNYDLISYFIEKELKIDEKDKNGDNALIVAARNFDFKLVNFLISRGADVEKVKDQMDKLAQKDDDFALYLDNLRLKGKQEAQTTAEIDAVPSEKGKSEQNEGFSSNQE